MSHVRQQIRDAAVTLLTGLASTGARVYPSRLYTLRNPDLPCLLVNTDDETSSTEGVVVGAVQQRTLKLVVRAVAKLTDSLDDALDTMIAEVEIALGNQTLAHLCASLQLEAIQIELADALDVPVGVASVTFSVDYFTATGAPSAVL